MNAKKNLWSFILHLELLIFGTTLFVLLFQTGVARGFSVFFYRGIFLLAIATLFTFFVAATVNIALLGKTFSLSDAFFSAIIVFCLNLVFFTHLPVTAERSVSTFLLGYMNENAESVISEEEMTKVLIDKYIYEHGAIKKRFEEQIVSGNILTHRLGYKITKRGKFVINLYNFVADLFRIDKRNIYP